jgi:hypothetical protein
MLLNLQNPEVKMQILKFGSHMKFRIAHVTRDSIEGEWPWGQVVGVVNDHRVVVRVDNELIASDLHGIFFGDLVELEMTFIEPDFSPVWQFIGVHFLCGLKAFLEHGINIRIGAF